MTHRIWRRLGAVLVVAAGMGACSGGTGDVKSDDKDGDGYEPGDDCDDNDASVNPTAAEDCSDGADNDCDGKTDGADAECGGGAGGAGQGGAGGAGQGGAGGGLPDCNNVPQTGQFPCDVYGVLVAHCHKCHTDPPLNAAPFSLLQFEKTREMYGNDVIWKRMEDVIKSGFMPLAPNEDLMGADLATMEAWFAQCAPPVPDGMGCEGL